MIIPKRKGVDSDIPQIIVILASSFASLSNGLLFSWTSPAIPELLADAQTNISLEEASYFTVISSTAMILSSPLIYLVTEAVGRRVAILLVTAPQLLSWVLAYSASNIWMYYLSRMIAGVGDAAFYGTVPTYVCEIATPRVRGIWGSGISIYVYMGIFLVNVIGAYCNIKTTAIICGCIPILHFVAFWFMPESPYYLLKTSKEAQAKKALQTLRWRDDVEEELDSLKADVERQMSEGGSLQDLYKIKSNRKALLICALIRVAQQFTGLSAFEMYTQYTFQQAGGSVSEKTSSMIFSGILLICVALSAALVEPLGRRPLMILSCSACSVILMTLTCYFFIKQYSSFDLAIIGWLPLAGMSLYITFCSPGMGILPTLMLGELFSSSIKGKAVSVMNIMLALCLIVVPKLFQSLTYNFGIAAPFLFFTVNCIICTVLSYLFVIETKGKTLEEIQQELKGNKL